MRISVRFSDDIAVMSLSGKFVAGSDGPFLRQKVKDLIEAGTRKLLLDFSGVPYIDSTGLGFLAGSRATVESAGSRLVLASLTSHVRKVLDDVKLSQFFEIAPDEAAGITRLHSKSETPRTPSRKSTSGKKSATPEV